MFSSYIRRVRRSKVPAKPFCAPQTLRILEALGVLVLLVFLIQAFHHAYRPEGYDFTPRLEAARALVSGVNPYLLPTPFPLTYPLFICVLLLPLAWLPYGLANLLWFLLGAVCLWFSARWTLEAYDSRAGERDFRFAFILFFFALLNLIQNNFVNGQVNLAVLALCLLFFKSLNQKRHAAAGAFLAAAVAFKCTPLILAAYLVFRREWKTLAWTFFFTPLFLFALPAIFGGAAIFGYYQGYLFHYVLPSFSSPPFPPGTDFQLKNYLHALFPSLGGVGLSLAADLPVLALPAWLQLSNRKPSMKFEVLIFSAYMALAPWLTPISETHHLAAIFPAILILTRYFLWEKTGPWGPRLLALGMVYALTWAGKFSFEFYFLLIGTCYFLMLYLAWKEGGGAFPALFSGGRLDKKGVRR
jgi:hypothetical protein